ncbi:MULTISPECIES: type II toxin-antitoxin system HipA family toxin [Clostridia]|jgi:serine/threonine-protein kinase HipA|uniref:type II toxin-antitoxin system HipA family toxin n=1 Tax=Clostridia TaxID=186801 RepID=UPI000E5194D0|nr:MULTISPECIES: type II toxin-antitoxin system HipA family toxin [Clostridia]RHV70616.1 type II toxin-antitoxin system HipA family toxin [Roseburia sp. OM02-15]
MKQNKALQVLFDNRVVGTLALAANHKVVFQYDDSWLEQGFSISPFSLPLENQVFVPTKDYFDGLFGVFADSLPDHWGRLLLKRLLLAHEQNPDKLTVIDRLAIVGKSGMGALTYYPEQSFSEENDNTDLDELAFQCQKILHTEYSDKLDELYRLGGTSGGARPKIMTTINDEDWIIKFSAHVDGENAGKMEYDYSCCARKCGITMSETKLFPSEVCEGYFGIKRFDRISDISGTKRVHMLTAAALLELDFEQPSLDYHSLMKLTKIITRDNKDDVENMFRRMCFNVFAHNRDDHSKNFTYLYDESADSWRLSPAYDLTYSNTYYGEHTTTVDGNGRNPGKKELLAVGTMAGIKKELCMDIITEIKSCVNEMLGMYLNR